MYSFRDLYCSSYLHKLCSKSYQRAKCGVQLPVALINFHVPLVLPRVRVVGLFSLTICAAASYRLPKQPIAAPVIMALPTVPESAVWSAVIGIFSTSAFICIHRLDAAPPPFCVIAFAILS